MIVYPHLKKPEAGQPIKSAWGDSVVTAIKSITPISGKNVRLKRTEHGTVIDVDIPPQTPAPQLSSTDISSFVDEITNNVVEIISAEYEYGVTGNYNVVTSMTYNKTTHNFDYTFQNWTFTNGRLTQVGADQISTVFTAVQESY